MIVPSRLRLAVFAGAAFAVWAFSAPASAQSLRGSAASLDRQNSQARVHDFTYIDTPNQVRRFVDAGYLVQVRGNRDFELHAVSFPYARPEAELFIRRLAAQYRAACGEKLVVTLKRSSKTTTSSSGPSGRASADSSCTTTAVPSIWAMSW